MSLQTTVTNIKTKKNPRIKNRIPHLSFLIFKISKFQNTVRSLFGCSKCWPPPSLTTYVIIFSLFRMPSSPSAAKFSWQTFNWPRPPTKSGQIALELVRADGSLSFYSLICTCRMTRKRRWRQVNIILRLTLGGTGCWRWVSWCRTRRRRRRLSLRCWYYVRIRFTVETTIIIK